MLGAAKIALRSVADNVWLYLCGLLLLATLFCYWRWDVVDGKLAKLNGEAGAVLSALRTVSGNDGLKWKDAPAQVLHVGDANRQLKLEIADTNQTLTAMAEEAVRLRGQAAAAVEIAQKAEAQRKAALATLKKRSVTPAQRKDSEALLKDVNAALDLVYEAGL